VNFAAKVGGNPPACCKVSPVFAWLHVAYRGTVEHAAAETGWVRSTRLFDAGGG
jgi:hypothetical protein